MRILPPLIARRYRRLLDVPVVPVPPVVKAGSVWFVVGHLIPTLADDSDVDVVSSPAVGHVRVRESCYADSGGAIPDVVRADDGKPSALWRWRRNSTWAACGRVGEVGGAHRNGARHSQ